MAEMSAASPATAVPRCTDVHAPSVAANGHVALDAHAPSVALDGYLERRTVNILGIEVDATTLSDATASIVSWIAQRRQTYVCVTGVHGLMESQRAPDLKRIHNAAGMVTPDGMPLVYIGRAAGWPECTRVYGPDLMLEVCRASVARGYRHFFYGTTPETLAKLTACLREAVPGLEIAGTYAPPFRALTESERCEVAGVLNASEADVIWVGLSTPKQERWMAENRGSLNAPVLVGVGAAFDFHAGTLRRAPRWISRCAWSGCSGSSSSRAGSGSGTSSTILSSSLPCCCSFCG